MVISNTFSTVQDHSPNSSWFNMASDREL